MTTPFYASAEQIMRDRSELAKKGIAKGRSVISMSYQHGVLFVAENPSRTLHKISELYDRLGFAGVGKFNEFEALRRFGITRADKHGYEYDRIDVNGQTLANYFALYLGTVFSEQPKPYEVEICVAEVPYEKEPVLFKISYDGSIIDESDFLVMGGNTEPIIISLKENFRKKLTLEEAIKLSITSLETQGTKKLGIEDLEVAILDSRKTRRAFQRITGENLIKLIGKDSGKL